MISLMLILFWIFVAFMAVMIFIRLIVEYPHKVAGVIAWIIGAVIFIAVLYNYKSGHSPATDDAIQRIMRGTNKDY